MEKVSTNMMMWRVLDESSLANLPRDGSPIFVAARDGNLFWLDTIYWDSSFIVMDDGTYRTFCGWKVQSNGTTTQDRGLIIRKNDLGQDYKHADILIFSHYLIPSYPWLPEEIGKRSVTTIFNTFLNELVTKNYFDTSAHHHGCIVGVQGRMEDKGAHSSPYLVCSDRCECRGEGFSWEMPNDSN